MDGTVGPARSHLECFLVCASLAASFQARPIFKKNTADQTRELETKH